MEQKLTIYQAYKAMYKFLITYYYHIGKPEEVGLLLSDMQLVKNRKPAEDGMPADPAMWEDWLEAVKKVLNID